jgi:hypothetical protein
MNPALLVLNPREIPECIEAIESLDIPTCWLSYMNESWAAACANTIMAAGDYSHYVILSDDTIPTQDALDLVLAQLEHHPVVTGYCNLDQNDHAHLVNLTTNWLNPLPATEDSYSFLMQYEVDRADAPTIPTTFVGLALTAMPKSLWMDFPLQTSGTGGQMDYVLSYRLQQKGIPMVAAVGAFIEHVKERWSKLDTNPAKRLLIGERPAGVHWTNVKVAT